ncbi:hypothetical protein MMC08_007718 [Hypocenomyce scalaris]|nr:hypothetical protein [Hypocenomyce scalaris]
MQTRSLLIASLTLIVTCDAVLVLLYSVTIRIALGLQNLSPPGPWTGRFLHEANARLWPRAVYGHFIEALAYISLIQIILLSIGFGLVSQDFGKVQDNLLPDAAAYAKWEGIWETARLALEIVALLQLGALLVGVAYLYVRRARICRHRFPLGHLLPLRMWPDIVAHGLLDLSAIFTVIVGCSDVILDYRHVDKALKQALILAIFAIVMFEMGVVFWIFAYLMGMQYFRIQSRRRRAQMII